MRNIISLCIILLSLFIDKSFCSVVDSTMLGIMVADTFSTIKTNNNGIIETDKKWFNKLSSKYSITALKHIFHVRYNNFDKYYSLEFTNPAFVDSVKKDFESQSEVLQSWYIMSGDFYIIPNDSLFSLQWGLNMISVLDAWDEMQINDTVIVGVIDSGIDIMLDSSGNASLHPDLSSNIWNLNGHYGFNYDESEDSQYPIDSLGHGTHVAGIIGATTNNSIGVASTIGNYPIKILPIKISSVRSDLAAGAVMRAVDPDGNPNTNDGAKIINCSWGFKNIQHFDALFELDSAFDYAYHNNVLCVASLGNEPANLSNTDELYGPYPARFDNVLSVIALDSNKNIASYSSYADWADICAPGGSSRNRDEPYTQNSIISTTPRYEVSLSNEIPGWTEEYGYLSGTSMAAPYVAGVAALMRVFCPKWTANDIRQHIKETADNIDAYVDSQYIGYIGSGLINAYRAIKIPKKPKGIVFSQMNDHPFIIWKKNVEPDLWGYYVYKHYIDNPGGNEDTFKIFQTDTSFIDYAFDVSQKPLDWAEYWVTAVDSEGNESPATTSHTYNGQGPLWKRVARLQLVDTLSLDTIRSGQLVHFPREDYFGYGALTISPSFVGDAITWEFPVRYPTGRLYLTIDLEQLSISEDSIRIDSAYLYLYQRFSYGDGVYGAFPVFEEPGGDTARCVLDHINYGDSLELEEWTVGDYGMPGTLESAFAVVSTTPDSGYRIIDVTEALREDITAGRPYSQYRIRFTVDGDDDEQYDLLHFDVPTWDEMWPPPSFLVVHYSVITPIVSDNNSRPQHFRLLPPYPNPFNTTVTIPYALPTTTDVTISIYDLQGRLVRRWHQGAQSPGYYRLVWMGRNQSGREVGSGLYLVRLETQRYAAVRKLLLIK